MNRAAAKRLVEGVDPKKTGTDRVNRAAAGKKKADRAARLDKRMGRVLVQGGLHYAVVRFLHDHDRRLGLTYDKGLVNETPSPWMLLDHFHARFNKHHGCVLRPAIIGHLLTAGYIKQRRVADLPLFAIAVTAAGQQALIDARIRKDAI